MTNEEIADLIAENFTLKSEIEEIMKGWSNERKELKKQISALETRIKNITNWITEGENND